MQLIPGPPLQAAQPNELRLILAGPPLKCIGIEQREPGSQGPLAQTDRLVPVLHHADGTPYVLFTPILLGKVGVNLNAFFPDGGISSLRSTVDVIPPARDPALLMIQVGGLPGRDNDLFRLGLSDPRWKSTAPAHWEYLYPAAYYTDFSLPVTIDRGFLHFHVKQPPDNPVIELNQDGGMRPLRAGEALLETTFGNITRETCIQVRDTTSFGDNSRCDSLRAPRLPTPLDTTWAANPDGLASHIGVYSFFTSQLKVEAPNHPVEIGQPIEIPLLLGGGKIRSINFQQKAAGSNASIPSNWPPDDHSTRANLGWGPAKIIRDEGSSKLIQLTPILIGEETVSISVSFEDGGFDERFFHMQSLPSDRQLRRIRLDYVRDASGHSRLVTRLSYQQMTYEIFIRSLDGFHLRIDQPEIPVLRIDPDGTAHELHAGTATVFVQLGAIEQSTVVNVTEPLRP